MLIFNARIVTPEAVLERGWLHIEGERIAGIGAGYLPPEASAASREPDRFDAGERTLLPGFIDLHAHGIAGVDTMDAVPGALATMANYYARHGVTSFLAATWTAPHAEIRAALATVAATAGPQLGGATLLGAYLEGPYLNARYCGAQDSEHIRRATIAESVALLETGAVKVIALAPEFEENHDLIDTAVRQGIVVSAAHTGATYAQMQRAVEMGVRQVTHTFNAMRGLHHREPGTVGAALDFPELRCEVIADGFHVHAAALRLLLTAKGVDGVILITDAVRGAGLPDGTTYPQDGRRVTVQAGAARLTDGTLAGSTLTMDRALAHIIAVSGQPLDALWPLASRNAARALGIDGERGSLAPGYYADCVLVDAALDVWMTIAQGQVVYGGKQANL